MIHIITGSTLGGAEYVGDHLGDLLEENGKQITIHNNPDFNEIPKEDTWLLITSTHGAGEFPDNIQPFFEELKNSSSALDKVNFAVVAIGDKSYDTFCAAGKNAYQILKQASATPLTDCLTIDVLTHPVPEDAAEEWLNNNIELF
ncbi:FMN-binding protein MioC [Vibrio marisflavi]|uniref:Protein MioC n=1 Tax=Vibrio marisflavi CECT 7928 TaxID=634439 RepID=A0ABM9A8P5_9VIBR|nr:FMN-binding protein MioC [Vibrio marisflavi]CAH0541964.1 Protein MioC [Vibrio marisflavi CECT 7928]